MLKPFPEPASHMPEGLKGDARLLIIASACCRHGDSLRAGWRDIMECITRLHKLGLLPSGILAVDGESPDAAARRLPKPLAPARTSSSGSLFTRAFNR